jgi:ATP-dependent RNA helicase SUPV3L1/SUV3
VASALSPLFDADVAPGMAPNVAPALRGPLHRLREALGVVPGPTEPEISPAQRAQLKAAGIRAGRFALFMPALLKPRPMAMRAALLGLANGVPTPKLPAPSLVTLPLPHPSLPDALLQALGWVAAGPVWIRLDMAERTAAELAWLTRAGPVPIPADLAARLSLRVDLLPAVLRGLGVRVLPGAPLAAEQYGPPAPAMMAPRQRRAASQDPPRRPPPRGAVPGNDARNDSRPAVQERAAQGPFAALAALHARR